MTENLRQHIFSLLPIEQAEWQKLESKLSICEYRKGEYFSQKDKPSNTIGFIISGSFRTFCNDNAGEEITYLLQFENEFLTSFESFLTSLNSKFDIQALENSTILCLKKDDLEKLYKNSQFWEKFGRLIAEKMYLQTQNRYQDLLLENGEYRYLKLLNKCPNIFTRVPQYYIASLIGVRPQSLSRIRKNIQTKSRN